MKDHDEYVWWRCLWIAWCEDGLSDDGMDFFDLWLTDLENHV